MLEAFRKVAVVIDERGVVFQYSALHLEIVDAARERISQRLENEEGQGLAVVVFAFDAVALAPGLLEADLRVLIGMGERIREKGK